MAEGKGHFYIPNSALLDMHANTPLGECKCPAGEIGTYANSGNKYLLCKIERQHFPVSAAPVAVRAWCCDEYAECPTWIAAHDDPAAVERQHAAQDAVRQRAAEKGLRAEESEEDILRDELERAIEEDEGDDVVV